MTSQIPSHGEDDGQCYRVSVIDFANFCQHVIGRFEFASDADRYSLITTLIDEIPRVRERRAAVIVRGIAIDSIVRMITRLPTSEGASLDLIAALRSSAESSGTTHLNLVVGRTRDFGSSQSVSCESRRVHTQVQEALLFMNSEYADPALHLEALAKHVSLSPSHLDRLLSKETGLTFLRRLRRIRMAKAESLLRRGKLSMKEIAGAVGYNHVSTFNREFRRAHGCTPTAFRASQRT